MKRGDLTGPLTLLALSGAALVAGARVPRAPLWNAVGRVVASGPMDAAAVAQGGPADPLWGHVILQYELVRKAVDAVGDPELRQNLETVATQNVPVRAIAGRLLPLPGGHVAGAPVALHPAVPGTEQGIHPGMGVTVGPVLVGVVAEAESRMSYVRLITDPDCHVAVTIVPPPAPEGLPDRDRPDGPFIVKGRAGSRLLQVLHVPTTADVRVGDLVITSGAAGLLPAGLNVGRIVGVDNPDADTMWDIEVEPFLPETTPSAVALLLLQPWERERPGRTDVARSGEGR